MPGGLAKLVPRRPLGAMKRSTNGRSLRRCCPARRSAPWAIGGWGVFRDVASMVAERAALAAMLQERGADPARRAAAGRRCWALELREAYLRWVAATGALAERRARAALLPMSPRSSPRAVPEIRALAELINRLAGQRAELRADVAAQVREASRSRRARRNRLAALMAELTQSVVVCNLDGRILLYNSRARIAVPWRRCRAPTSRWRRADRPGPLHLRWFDRASSRMLLRACSSACSAAPHTPRRKFVTGTRAGQLLRVRMAPSARDRRAPGEAALNGFVLMLENITRDFADSPSATRRCTS